MSEDDVDPDPVRLKYVDFGLAGMSSVEYATSSSTIVGHANAFGAAAVGAANWDDTPAFGTTPAVTSYSSVGGMEIRIGPDGESLGTPIDRQKPDFVAPTGGNTTFFGVDTTDDADTLPNFSGTSAAAAHAAGIAALLLETAPATPPEQLFVAMRDSAIDMGASGLDPQTGSGLLSAEAAHTQLVASLTGASASLDAAQVGGSDLFSTTQQSPEFGVDQIPVDVGLDYQFTAWLRSGDDNQNQYDPANSQYFGFASYDIDGELILPEHVMTYSQATPTRLAKTLNTGDLTIELEDASGWYNNNNPTRRWFAWYGHTDLAGNVYPDYTYTRNVWRGTNEGGAWAPGGVDTNTNIITLSEPWPFGSVPVTTAVVNARGGNTYNYALINDNSVGDQWTEYSQTISGVDDTAHRKFRPGTAFIQPVLLPNQHAAGINLINVANVTVTPASPPRYTVGEPVELHVNPLDHDPNGRTYQWTQVAGPAIELSGATTSTASFAVPPLVVDSTFGFEVQISDGTTTETERVGVHALEDAGSISAAKALVDATTFNDADTFSELNDAVEYLGDDLIPIDLTKQYRLFGQAKSGDDNEMQYDPANEQYFGFASYDKDGLLIEPAHVRIHDGSARTTLREDLNVGDSVIKLHDAQGWYDSTKNKWRWFAWYPEGHAYPAYSYTRHVANPDNGLWAAGDVDLANNEIILRDPWAGSPIPKDTPVANVRNGKLYNYPNLLGEAVPDQWTTYNRVISGVDDSIHTSFRPGTAFIKPVIIANDDGGTDNLINWKNVEFKYKTGETFNVQETIDLHAEEVEFPGGELTYAWTQVGGPSVDAIFGADTTDATVTAPNALLDYTLQFEFSIADGVATTSEIVTIEVEAVEDYTTELGDPRALLETTTFGGDSTYSSLGPAAPVVGDNLIPVDPNRSYTLRALARSGNDAGDQFETDSRQFLGVRMFDENQDQILSQFVLKYPGSAETVLLSQLIPGITDNFFLVEDASGWNNAGVAEERSLASWNSLPQVDPDYGHADHYTENVWDPGDISFDGTKWSILLNGTWNGPFLDSGKKIRNAMKGDDELYTVLDDQSVPNVWTLYSGTIGGVLEDGSVDPTKFWPETAYIQPVFLPNTANGVGNLVTLTDVEVAHAAGESFLPGDPVELRVNALDFDGPLSYSWVQKTGPSVGEIENHDQPVASFRLPDTMATDELVFELTASDGTFAISKEIVVKVEPTAPQVDFQFELVDKTGNEISTVAVGDEFVLNAYTQDHRALPAGVFSAYLDLWFGSELAAVVTPPSPSSHFPNVPNFDTESRGLIDEAGGASDRLLGSGGDRQLLFSTTLVAEQPGTLLFRSDPSDGFPGGGVSAFGLEEPVPDIDIDYGSVSLEVTSPVIPYTSQALCGSVSFEYFDLTTYDDSEPGANSPLTSPVELFESVQNGVVVHVVPQTACSPDEIVLVDVDDDGSGTADDDSPSNLAYELVSSSFSAPIDANNPARYVIRAKDDVDAVDDTFNLVVRVPPEHASGENPPPVEYTSASIAVADDDAAAPACAVEITSPIGSGEPADLGEGLNLQLTVNAVNCSEAPTVTWQTSGTGAEYGAEPHDLRVLYQGIAQAENGVIVASGATDTFDLETHADSTAEPPSSITFTAAVGETEAHYQVNVIDTGGCALSMEGTPQTLYEANAPIDSLITVTATGPLCDSSVEVTFETDGSGAELSNDFDLLDSSGVPIPGISDGQFTLALAGTPLTGQFRLDLATADSVVEDSPSTVTFTATDSIDNAASTAIVIIDDDGSSPPPSVSASTANAEEGAALYYCNSPVSGHFSYSPGSGETWQTLGVTKMTFEIEGTAELETDYNFTSNALVFEHPPGTLVVAIPTGFTNESIVIQVVPATDHDEDEGDETVTLTLQTDSGLQSREDTVTIVDQIETVSFTAPDPDAHESGSDREGQFLITGNGNNLCGPFRLIIDTGSGVPNPATPIPVGYSNEDSDYVLSLANTEIGLGIEEFPPGNPLPDKFATPQDIAKLTVHEVSEIRIDVLPSFDYRLEGDETVRAYLDAMFTAEDGTAEWAETLTQYADVIIHDYVPANARTAEIEIDASSDDECTCTCVACVPDLVQFEMQDGSHRIAIVENYVTYISEGTHSTQMVVRGQFERLGSNWPSSITVKVEVDDWNDSNGSLALPNSPPLGFTIDMSGYTDPTIAFAVPVDLEGIETSSYRVRLTGQNDDLVGSGTDPIQWEAKTSHIIVNRRDAGNYEIAPNLVFPFLKRAIDVPMYQEDGSEEPVATPGTAIIRPDNTVSWYPEGKIHAANSISELTQDAIFYKLTDRFGNIDRFPIAQYDDGAGRVWPAGSHYSFTDRNGNVTQFYYDGQGRLDKIDDAFERTTTISYDTQNTETTVTFKDFADRETDLVYDSAAGTIVVSEPDPVSGPRPQTTFTFNTANDSITIRRHANTTANNGMPASRDQDTTIQYANWHDQFGYQRSWRGAVTVINRDASTWDLEAYRQLEGLPFGGSWVAGANTLTKLSDFQNLARLRDGRNYVTEYTIDHRGRALNVIDAHNQEFIYVRKEPITDGFGNVTKDRGELEQLETPDPDDFTQRPDLDLSLQENGPREPQITVFQYDSKSNVEKQFLPELEGVEFTLEWPLNPGYVLSKPQRFINELGQTTDYEIAANGDLKKITVFAPDARPNRGSHGSPSHQNSANRHDVNGDGKVSLADVIAIANELSMNGLDSGDRIVSVAGATYADVDGDGSVTPHDQLSVINVMLGFSEPDTGDPGYTDPEDFVVEFTYSAGQNIPKGLLTKEVLTTGRGAGLETVYEYFSDANAPSTYGQLKKITYAAQAAAPVTASVHFEYDTFGNLAKITDELGRATLLTYDVLDRPIQISSPDPDGAGPEQPLVTNYTYDAFDNVASVTVINTDTLSIPLVQTSHTTCYYYEEMDRLQWVVEAHPTQDTFASDCAILALPSDWDDAQANATGQWNNWIGRPITNIDFYDGNGNVRRMYDAEGRVREYEYDFLNRLTKVIEPDFNVHELTDQVWDTRADFGPVTTFVYDNLGNLFSTTDALSNETKFEYDDWNRLTKIEELSGPRETLFSYHPTDYGWVERVYDAEGRGTETQSDFLGRMTYVAEPQVGGQQPLTWLTYYADSQLNNVQDAEGNLTSYGYDPRARLTSVLAPEATSTTFTYDEANQLTSLTDALGRTTSYAYDDLGRRTQVTYPDPDNVAGGDEPPTMSYLYDSVGNLLKSTDELGHFTTHVYDHLFRAVETHAYRQDPAQDPDVDVTYFQYDLVDNRTELTDPAGNVTAWTYDKLDRVSVETRGGSSRVYRYDAVGNLRNHTDRNGRKIHYSYDDLYRVTQETWESNEGSGATELRYQFAYDRVDNLVSVADHGDGADLSFEYDALDRVTTEVQEPDGLFKSVELAHAYDQVGNRTTLAASVGGPAVNGEVVDGIKDFVTSYFYDDLYRLESVSQFGQTGGFAVANKRIEFTYDAASQLTEIHRYPGLDLAAPLVAHSLYEYDGAGRVTGITHSQTEVTGVWDGGSFADEPGRIAAYHLSYDAGNRLQKFSSWQDQLSVDYVYDDTNQLISATYKDDTGAVQTELNESYGYDGNGNRDAFQYSSGGQHLNQIAADDLDTNLANDYLYDGEGNRIRRTRPNNSYTEYEWDHRNRLTAVTEYDTAGQATKRISYRYDAFDRRIGKSVDDGMDGVEEATTWIYDGGHIVLAFTDSDGDGPEAPAISNRYLHGPMIDMILADEQVTSIAEAGTVYWPLTDHLGSVRDVVDSNGEVVNHVVYDSFGNKLDASAGTSETIDFLFGYTGRDWDEDVELQYNRARWYDPSVGAWISEDPIGFAAGDANLYRYVGNEVTGAIDPKGLQEHGVGFDPNYVYRPGERTYTGYTATNRDVDELLRPPFSEQSNTAIVGFINWGINNHPLQQELLERYAFCESRVRILSVQEMVDIGSTNNHIRGRLPGKYYGTPDGFLGDLARLRTRAGSENRSVSESVEYWRFSYARLRGTLGKFTVRYRGDLEVSPDGSWTFVGEFKFEDNFGFEHRAGAHPGRNGQCFLVRTFAPGNAFDIASEWHKVRMTSTGVFSWVGSDLERKKVEDTYGYEVLSDVSQ